MKTERLGLAFLPASTIRLLRVHEIACGPVVRGWPSLVKGAGLRILSRRGSQVQILPHASFPRPARRAEMGVPLEPDRTRGRTFLYSDYLNLKWAGGDRRTIVGHGVYLGAKLS